MQTHDDIPTRKVCSTFEVTKSVSQGMLNVRRHRSSFAKYAQRPNSLKEAWTFSRRALLNSDAVPLIVIADDSSGLLPHFQFPLSNFRTLESVLAQ
jgi:hypothetical protein